MQRRAIEGLPGLGTDFFGGAFLKIP
jgi:hypothetical protein